MEETAKNIQDTFLNHIRAKKTGVTVFLINGVKLQGIVTSFHNYSLLLKKDSDLQLVYKHAISTVMPEEPISLYDGEKGKK